MYLKRVFRGLSLFSVLGVLIAGLLTTKPAFAATTCGGTLTHTSTQSQTWTTFDANTKTAEWSGFWKYHTPAGHACDIQVIMLTDNSADYNTWFRPSTTDATKAQWDPTHVQFTEYNGLHSGYQTAYGLYTVPANTLESNRVKLFGTTAGYHNTGVEADVYDRLSSSDPWELVGAVTATFN